MREFEMDYEPTGYDVPSTLCDCAAARDLFIHSPATRINPAVVKDGLLLVDVFEDEFDDAEGVTFLHCRTCEGRWNLDAPEMAALLVIETGTRGDR